MRTTPSSSRKKIIVVFIALGVASKIAQDPSAVERPSSKSTGSEAVSAGNDQSQKQGQITSRINSRSIEHTVKTTTDQLRKPSSVPGRQDWSERGEQQRSALPGRGPLWLLDLTVGEVRAHQAKQLKFSSEGDFVFRAEDLEKLGLNPSRFQVTEYDAKCVIADGFTDFEQSECHLKAQQPMALQISDALAKATNDPDSKGYYDVTVSAGSADQQTAVLRIRVNHAFRAIGDLNRDGCPDFVSWTRPFSGQSEEVILLHLSKVEPSNGFPSYRPVKAIGIVQAK